MSGAERDEMLSAISVVRNGMQLLYDRAGIAGARVVFSPGGGGSSSSRDDGDDGGNGGGNSGGQGENRNEDADDGDGEVR
jgi:hypothetical protein